MKHLDLFSGIGGFSLAADWVWPDIEHIFCDNEPFLQAILRKHWPTSKIYGDIRELTWERYVKDAEEKGRKAEDNFVAYRATKNTSKKSIGLTQKNLAKRQTNIGKQIYNGIDNLPKHEGRNYEMKSSATMEQNAFVVESSIGHSSRSTIKTTMDQKIGRNMEQDICTNSSKGENSQESIKSSATTATTQNLSTKSVLTNYDRTLTANAERNRLQESRAKLETVGNRQLDEDSSPFILTGGFPCQPFSQAGRRKGTADDRHLWPEMLRVIHEFSPTWVIGENVGGIITWESGLVFQQVCADLEAEGYEVQPFVIPAVAVNAPHRRDRVWFVGHSSSARTREQTTNIYGRKVTSSVGEVEFRNGTNSTNSDVTNSKRKGWERSGNKDTRRPRQPHRHGFDKGWDWNQNWLEVATELCIVDDGLPNGLARPRGWRNAALKGAGNAIVPQVAYEIMKAIKLTEEI